MEVRKEGSEWWEENHEERDVMEESFVKTWSTVLVAAVDNRGAPKSGP